MRDKRYQSTEKGLDDLADLMLGRINSCVDDRTKKAVKIKSAIVTKVNDDGTVNVQLPNDDGSDFSRLQNQSVYELNVGDSVEILLKEGSFTNSWVIAKHGGGTKRVNLVNQGTVSVISGGTSSGGSSGGGSSGTGDVALEQHILNHSNPHMVTKTQVGLSNVDNVKQYSVSNPPPYPVSSVNSKTGAVQLTASDVGAVSNSSITKTLTDSDDQIPTSKAVADAMSAAGYGDMLKAKYAPNSEDTVEKAYKDEDGNNIKSTYQKKGGVLSNTNLNTVVESGNYFLGTGNTNIPDDCAGNIMMVGGASTAAFQAIFKFSTNSIVHRCYNGTTWTNWRDTNTALIVSSTQPTNQSPGDLWYQIVD